MMMKVQRPVCGVAFEHVVPMLSPVLGGLAWGFYGA
jgi:hypothetical protein